MQIIRRNQFAVLLLLIGGGSCKSRAPDADQAVSVNTQPPAQSVTLKPEKSGEEERRTFGVWDPLDPDGNLPNGHSRFDIAVDLYASGRLVLALDTIWPRVDIEDTESTRTLADSLVVTGISTKETWTNNCRRGGQYQGFVVAVIPNRVTARAVPRLAWNFDTVSYRIHALPTDSLQCAEISD